MKETNTAPLRVLGIAGSLRTGSYNRALIHAAEELAPENMNVESFGLGDLPHYDADLDTDEDRPASVRALKEAIGAADALLVATPEYNHGVPGVLKNAIDWASRPSRNSVLKDLSVGLMGVSPGRVGTARAQEHLKQILDSTLSHVMPHPGVLVGGAGDKFDAEGRLTDEATRSFVEKFMVELAAWTRRLHRRSPAEEKATSNTRPTATQTS